MGVYSEYLDNLKGFQEITVERKKQLARIASIRKRSSILTIASDLQKLRWTPLLGQNRGDIKIGSRYPEVKDSTIPLLVDSTGVDVYTSAGVR